jgi:hypothetical protein
MASQPRGAVADDGSTRVGLWLIFEGTSVRGVLTDAMGVEWPFDTWIALLGLLRSLPEREAGSLASPVPARVPREKNPGSLG